MQANIQNNKKDRKEMHNSKEMKIITNKSKACKS